MKKEIIYTALAALLLSTPSCYASASGDANDEESSGVTAESVVLNLNDYEAILHVLIGVGIILPPDNQLDKSAVDKLLSDLKLIRFEETSEWFPFRTVIARLIFMLEGDTITPSKRTLTLEHIDELARQRLDRIDESTPKVKSANKQ